MVCGRPLDTTIDNAGITTCPETRVGPGWAAQFATHHLGHFATVNGLWPLIARGRDSRVVSVSSRGHPFSAMPRDDAHFTHDDDKWLAHGQAKIADILVAVELDAWAAAVDPDEARRPSAFSAELTGLDAVGTTV